MKETRKLISALGIGLAMISSPVALAEDDAAGAAVNSGNTGAAGAGAVGGLSVGTAVALGVLGAAILVESGDDGPKVSPPARPTTPPTNTSTTTATSTAVN
jgi:hypothetical protein